MAGTVTFIEFVSGAFATVAKAADGTTVTGWISSASVAVNTDIFLLTSAVSDKVSAATVTGYGLDAGVVGEPWAFSAGGADEANHIFMVANIQGTADTLANGGIGIIVADNLATDSFGTWYVGPQAGSLGGWEYFVIDPALDFDAVTAGSGSWTLSGNPDQLSGVDGVGVRWKVTNSIMGASDNAFVQTLSVGVGYRVTGSGCTFADFSGYEATNFFGALQTKSGILFPLGKLRVGIESGAGNTDFTDSGFTVVWQGQARPGGAAAVRDGHYELSVVKGSGTTTLSLTNGTLAAGTPCTFDLELNGATTVTITNLSVDRARLVTLDSAVTWNGGTVKNSGLIDATGAIFKDVAVLTSTAAANTSALRWNSSDDPDGNLDGCSFSKGTNAHHAIELGTTSPTTMTLRNLAFTGFNASNAQNDSTLHVKRTTGTVTINLIGCSGNISYKSDGATVVLVVDPVTLLVHVQDIDTGLPIQSARVWVPVSSSAGGWPYQESVTIANAGTTATVTHTDHGLSTNDYVYIVGASHWQNNGTFQVTVTGTNTYTYTMQSAPGSNPSGSITSTFVVINAATNASGDASSSYSYTSDQPVIGRVRKATSGSQTYKNAPVTGTIDSVAGLSVTINLIKDS